MASSRSGINKGVKMRKTYRKPQLRKHGKLSALTRFHGSFHHHHDLP
jgi:hypothetical protein